MKKISIALLVAFAALYACSKQKPTEKTTLGDFTAWMNSPEQLNGKVKEVREVTYWAVENNGTVEKGNILTKKEHDSLSWSADFSVLFNVSGMVLRTDDLDEMGSVIQSWVFTVDSGKYTRADKMLKDTIRNVAKFETNDQGNFTKLSFYKPEKDSLTGWYESSYDNLGNRQRLQWVNANGEKGGSQNFTWDANKHVTAVQFLNSKDSLTGSWTMTYDEKGFMATQKMLDGKQVVTSDLTMKNIDFDEKGNYTQSVVYKDGKPFLLTTRKYIYF